MNTKQVLMLLSGLTLALPTNVSAEDSLESKEAAFECDKVSAHPDDHLSLVKGVT